LAIVGGTINGVSMVCCLARPVAYGIYERGAQSGASHLFVGCCMAGRAL
jgi:hypothetical protein